MLIDLILTQGIPDRVIVGHVPARELAGQGLAYARHVPLSKVSELSESCRVIVGSAHSRIRPRIRDDVCPHD